MGLFDYWRRPRKCFEPIDLTHTSKFVGNWVCLDEKNRVCGVGKTVQEALDDATKRNYKMPTMMFVNKEPRIYG